MPTKADQQASSTGPAAATTFVGNASPRLTNALPGPPAPGLCGGGADLSM